jgi:hypothetical protein
MGLIFLHIFASPAAAFFMILIWAAIFGDTVFFLVEDNMIEEWIICIQIYISIMLLVKFKRALYKCES